MCSKNHVFHRNCATKFILNAPFDPIKNIGEFPSPTLSLKCPHCDLDVLPDDIQLKLKCSNNSVFLPKSLKPVRMTSEQMKLNQRSTNSILRLEIEKIIPSDIFETLLNSVNDSTLASINFTTKDLFLSIHNNDVKKVADIIGSGFDITTKFKEFKNGTCLHLVATFGSIAMTYLIICRASSSEFINLLDEKQRTPIMCSVAAKKYDILKLLIQCGADATIKVSEFGLKLVLHLCQIRTCRRFDERISYLSLLFFNNYKMTII